MEVTEKGPLEIVDWTDSTGGVMAGRNEETMKYFFTVDKPGKEGVDFTIVLDSVHTQKHSGNKVFHANVSQKFTLRNITGELSLETMYKMLMETNTLYAQEFYKRNENNENHNRKVRKPALTIYRITLLLCIQDLLEGRAANYEV